jgi:glutathione peroxidase-family protein
MKTQSAIILSALLLIIIAAHPLKKGYEVGDIVIDFKLKNIDGKIVSLSNYADAKGAIIIFDSNTCPYSKAYNERIIGLNQKYSTKGFPVIVINANDPIKSPGDSYDEMVKYAQENKYNFPYLIDETQIVASTFGATNTPHVYVVEKSKDNFKVAYIGAIDNNVKDASAADKKYVEDAVDALLAGKEVQVKKTKAIGCTIKWRS